MARIPIQAEEAAKKKAEKEAAKAAEKAAVSYSLVWRVQCVFYGWILNFMEY